MRPLLVAAVSVLTALAGCSSPPTGGAGAARPNVLLICVDDLKPALGCYGDRLAKTPNLDRLAARGVRFDLAFSNQAVCAPSRNNLMLGARSTSLGIYGFGRDFRTAWPDAVTLSQHFMRHGWRAESVGKVLHTGHGNHDDDASWSVPSVPGRVVEYLDPADSAGGRLTREESYFTNQRLGDIHSLPKGSAWEGLDVPDDAYSDGRIAAEAVRRLRDAAARPGTPLFLAVGFVKPHLPHTPPKRYWDLHDPAAFPLPELRGAPAGAPAYAGKSGGEIVNYEPLTEESLRDDAVRRRLIHGYYAAASFADAQVGRVLDELDRTGLAERTIVVLWGDHGWHLGDHGWWTKHTNYEQAVRIPLLVVAPGVTKPGGVTRRVAETVDLYPTLAELAGLPAPRGPQPIDGTSLVPSLRDPGAAIRDHAYHCFPRDRRLGRAIRTERHRLVEWKVPGDPPEAGEYELYDYAEDPRETRNLAADRPGEVAALRTLLAGHPEPLPRK